MRNSSKTLKGLRSLQADDISKLKDTLKSEMSTEVRCQNLTYSVELRKQLSEWHKEQHIAVNKLARAQQKMFRNLIKVENDKRRIQRQTYINRQEDMRQKLRETALKQREEAMKKSMESMLSLAIGNADEKEKVTKKPLRQLPTIAKSSKAGELRFESGDSLGDSVLLQSRYRRKRRTGGVSASESVAESKRPTHTKRLTQTKRPTQYIETVKTIEKYPPMNVTKSKVLPSISRHSDTNTANFDGSIYRQKTDLDIIAAVSMANDADALSSDALGVMEGSAGDRLTTPHFKKPQSKEHQYPLREESCAEKEGVGIEAEESRTHEKDASKIDADKFVTPVALDENAEQVRSEGMSTYPQNSIASPSPADSSTRTTQIKNTRKRSVTNSDTNVADVSIPSNHLVDQSLNSNQVLPPIGGEHGQEKQPPTTVAAADGKVSKTRASRRRTSSISTDTTSTSTQSLKKKDNKNASRNRLKERQSLREDMQKYQVGIAVRPVRIPEYEAPVVDSVVKYTKNRQGSFVSSDVKVKPAKDSFKLPSKKSVYLLDKARIYERERVEHRQNKLEQFYGSVDDYIDRSKRTTFVPKPKEIRKKSQHLPPSQLQPTIQSRTFGHSLEGYHLEKDVHDLQNTRYLRFYGTALPHTPNTNTGFAALSTPFSKEKLSSWGQASYSRPKLSLAYP